MLLSILPLALLFSITLAQNSSSSGYTNYNLTISGDDDSLLYETDSTLAGGNSTFGPPDVFLNASVHVGEIDLLVANLSAKINLDAQVLNLLKFNAGVDVEIGRVNLLIQNVTAKVLLEARLENLVLMINDTLNSIDLNPIIASLGNTVGTLTGDLTGALTGSNSTSAPNSSRGSANSAACRRSRVTMMRCPNKGSFSNQLKRSRRETTSPITMVAGCLRLFRAIRSGRVSSVPTSVS